jgi:hypothetical protein
MTSAWKTTLGCLLALALGAFTVQQLRGRALEFAINGRAYVFQFGQAAPTDSPCPPARPFCAVAWVARPAEGGSHVGGYLVNDTAQPIEVAVGALVIVAAAGGVATNTQAVTIAPGESFSFGGIAAGLAPNTPLRLVVTVPGFPALEQEIVWAH